MLILGLLAVTSNDDQPVNRFVDLFNTNKLPSLLNDGVMDPKILKHYVLVHDNHDGPSEKYSDSFFIVLQLCAFLYSNLYLPEYGMYILCGKLLIMM